VLDRAAIDDALVAVLAGDATLAGLLPDGVWFDEAPPNARQFALVALLSTRDEATFGGRALEDAVYLVKAVSFDKSAATALAAAAQIDALLEDASLAVAGGDCLAVFREQAIRYPEVDALDPSIRWQHCGGHYRVQFAVSAAAAQKG